MKRIFLLIVLFFSFGSLAIAQQKKSKKADTSKLVLSKHDQKQIALKKEKAAAKTKNESTERSLSRPTPAIKQ